METTWNEYEKFMIDGGQETKMAQNNFQPDDSDVDLIPNQQNPM